MMLQRSTIYEPLEFLSFTFYLLLSTRSQISLEVKKTDKSFHLILSFRQGRDVSVTKFCIFLSQEADTIDDIFDLPPIKG